MSYAGPDRKPDQAEMSSRIAGREQEKDPQGDVDAENHVKIRGLLRLPGPPSRPDPIQGHETEDEDQTKRSEGAAEPGGADRRVHGLLLEQDACDDSPGIHGPPRPPTSVLNPR